MSICTSSSYEPVTEVNWRPLDWRSLTVWFSRPRNSKTKSHSPFSCAWETLTLIQP